MPIAAADLDQHRDYLYAYALRRVGDSGLAEDLVQDTFVAALGAARGFRGDSSVRTWLTGILKHRIVDSYRAPEHAVESLDANAEEAPEIPAPDADPRGEPHHRRLGRVTQQVQRELGGRGIGHGHQHVRQDPLLQHGRNASSIRARDH